MAPADLLAPIHYKAVTHLSIVEVFNTNGTVHQVLKIAALHFGFLLSA